MTRRTRLYYPDKLISGEKIILNIDASRYLLTVLRKTIGEAVFLFNNTDFEFESALVEINKKQAVIQVGAPSNPNIESNLKIHLGQAISRGERMDYAIQKAVELGVDEITPLFSEYCQIKLKSDRVDNKISHWQAIAISAAEQSGRTKVPKINLPEEFNIFIQKKDELKIICLPKQNKDLLDLKNTAIPKNILLLIGAEGGFSDAEIQLALKQDFISMSLGPRILRTETAPIVALSLLQQKWGDLH